MAFNIFSVDFFKKIAQVKADVNKDGKINEEYEKNGQKINEKSIFNTEYKRFDLDNDGKVDERDVSLYLQSMGATPEGEIEKGNILLERAVAQNKFSRNVIDVVNYLAEANDEKLLARYWHSISKFLGIDNSKEGKIDDIRKQIESYHMASLTLSVNSEYSERGKNLALSLSAKLINTADMAKNDLYVLTKALEGLESLSLTTGIDNSELVRDIKGYLSEVKSNLEQELGVADSEEEKQHINAQIESINVLIDK